jgi:transposase-like protein
MSGRHSRDPKLERRWRDLVARWERSDLTVRDFCSDHQISEPSFYAWRRELAARDRVGTPATATLPTFVPVRVAPPVGVEVVLPTGVVVRVPAGADPAAVARLVAALGATPC